MEEQGIQPGDRVALKLPNVPAFVVWYYATLRLGAISVSVSTRLADSEVAFIVGDCDAKVVVAVDDCAGVELPDCVQHTIVTSELGDEFGEQHSTRRRLASAPATDNNPADGWYDADPDEAALILYTSGTTGFAKGATLSHGNVRSNVSSFNHLCNMRAHDRVLLAVPLFHCFGQNALLNSVLNVGATIVLQSKFDLNEAKRLIAEHDVSQLYGVPMMFQLLMESCDTSDLKSVNYCFSAAAKLPIQVAQAWREKFDMPICEGYGLTETSPFASYNHRDHFVPGSIGTPIDNVEMKIVDTETGVDCPAGELGEIAIRGPNVMLGYWDRPDETFQAIRDGWFLSGDIGRIDENGFFYIVDRVKDMIAVGGLKVFPAEVERVLLDHPLASQVAVVGVDDAVFGEQVIAFAVLVDNAPDDAIQQLSAFASKNLGNYKRPRRFFSIDALPRNPSGKVLKTKLREQASELVAGSEDSESQQFAAEAFAPTHHDSTRPATLRHSLASAFESERETVATNFLQQLVVRLADLDEVPTADARFLELGLDSLLLVELSTQIQVELGPEHPLPATLVFDYPRLCDLAGFLVQALSDSATEAKVRVDPGA